ncbi:uncharacterized protein LOC122080336 [Macadamia integrifolia]|uniref:uncharacterized protein LOC122080336 n=1 Tax=Macadamia integrifolia TaxID=60698 RepID=UPI001C4EEFB7|nr:uncharacterized protein LOC122080336 [Macadamia integrifolia]
MESLCYHTMETKKIVVVVEDVDTARTALQWALHNLLRYGDLITLLHVFPSSKSRSSKNKKKQRLLRLRGFQLALSFKDLCDSVFGAKVEIVVREGDEEGRTIASLVREISASVLVVGLHDQSFLYKLAMAHGNVTSYLNCRVIAIKQPLPITQDNHNHPTSLDLTQIEIAGLWVPPLAPQKIPYRILPNPYAIVWKTKRGRRKGSS